MLNGKLKADIVGGAAVFDLEGEPV